MATPRSPRSLARALALTTAAVAALSVLPGGIGHADPTQSLASVEAQVNALNDKVDRITEQYNESSIALAQANRQAAVARARVRAAQADLAKIRTQMGALAASAYESGGADQFVQLVSTSTPQTFLDRASSLNRIAAGQSAQLAAAATARHRLDAASEDAAVQAAAAAAVAKTLGQDKQQIQVALNAEQQLLSGLKADQRRALDAARRATWLSASRSRVSVAYNGPASGRAAVALRAAYAELGKPYQWAGAGPDSFDCSGLTMWSWGAAGVSLSHSAAAQYDEGEHISQSQLRPGDLVFFGSPIHHVGMYVGGGNMIDAPHSGDVVKVEGIFWNEYVGAARP